MKMLFYLLMGLLPFTLNADEKKVPFYVPVDFSKKGTVYETDFKTPWNIWGSTISFHLYITYFKRYTQMTEEERQIDSYIQYGNRNGKTLPEGLKDNQYFKLKATLTPLGWASNKIKVSTVDYSKISIGETNFSWMHKDGTWKRKMYQDDEKIEFIINIPLYDGYTGTGGKYIMLADLQRLRNYHIKVESLEDVELPEGVTTKFAIDGHSTKH
ncbi:hypothetical protein L5F09_01520 [Aliarcobacter butzleri]|uniref:hypothetical protein n=1 Tax=Aliarcobacter butzleri TaxID=28197 RepID=UPI001EDAEF0B|nr:hypothetical protein [Aliarcobacter butzleri]MCG3664424.1 hypothetical protein [Aliarcobacter butzleri]